MAGPRPIWAALVYAALGALALRRVATGTAPPLIATGGRPHAAAAPQQRCPARISWAGGRAIAKRLYRKVNDERLLAVAGGVVFFALLAAFPAIAAFVSIYGLFADASTINGHLSLVDGVLPGGAVGLLRDQIGRLAANKSGLSVGFAIGLALALWSANSGMKAIIDALNIAYETKENRSFVVLNLQSLALTLGAIASLLVAFAIVVVAPMAFALVGLQSVASVVFVWLRWPFLLVLAVVGLALLYRFGPSRRQPRWRWITPGGVTAAVGWLVGSALLSWYLGHVANYDVTYGSLGAAVGMMMWMWVSTIVILFGAQLNAEIERQGRAKSINHE